MQPLHHFSDRVLPELLAKTRWVWDHFERPDPIKTRRWRCLSCNQPCEYSVQSIVLLNGQKVWEINVDQVSDCESIDTERDVNT